MLSFIHWNQIPKEGGIYAIIHVATGRKYIGSAVNLYGRARHHRNDLRNGVHHSSHLQRTFWKYGEAAFAIEILELVADRTKLIVREQSWIDREAPAFNNAQIAGSILGVRRSAETLEKLRMAARARSASPQYRAKLSAASLGKKKSAEHRLALKLAVTGFRHTDESKAKIAVAGTGRKHTAESRAKMSAVQKGRVLSPETCARISAAKKGITPMLSEESKQRRSENLKAAWQRRRLCASGD